MSDCPAREWARNATPEDVERLMVEVGRLKAVRSAMMQLAATLARRGDTVTASLIAHRVDAALQRDVCIDDFVIPRVNSDD